MGVERIRADFPILDRKIKGKPLIYFDSAATTHRPRQVLQTIQTFYETYNANVHRSPHTLGMEATELYEQAHENVARFIGARDAREIIFVRNCTEAINLVAYSLTNPGSRRYCLQRGDEVVVTVMEHHSNLVPWQMACHRSGALLKVVDMHDDGTLDLERLAEAVSRRTRLVCCTHVSNVLGTINPVQEIGRLAREVSALYLVDGAQSAPHMPVDVKDVGCDFFAFSGHKMLAPMGIGALYGREELLTEMSPFLYGGEMVDDVTRYSASWNRLPWKFEAGTANVCAGIALGGAADLRTGLRLEGAIDYLQRIGLTEIQAHERRLAQHALGGLQRIRGVRVYGPPDVGSRTGVIAFNVEGARAHLIADLLNDEGIAVRSGGHCAYPLAQRLGLESTVRISFYAYNTEDEVDRFLGILDDIVKYRLL